MSLCVYTRTHLQNCVSGCGLILPLERDQFSMWQTNVPEQEPQGKIWEGARKLEGRGDLTKIAQAGRATEENEGGGGGVDRRS